MENKQLPLTNNLHPQSEDRTFSNQLQIVYEYLNKHTATASMVADATGIYQKNICRYKRVLEQACKLWVIERKACTKTGFLAWYLTTDPSKAPKEAIQLTMF